MRGCYAPAMAVRRGVARSLVLKSPGLGSCLEPAPAPSRGQGGDHLGTWYMHIQGWVKNGKCLFF